VKILVADAGPFVTKMAVGGHWLTWCTQNPASNGVLAACDVDTSCASATIVAKVGICGGVATDSIQVYWTDYANKSVGACDLPDCEGGVKTLASGLTNPEDIVVAKGSAYFADDDGIHSVPVEGGKVEMFAIDPSVARIASDGTNLYWTSVGVHWCPLDGCPSPACVLAAQTGEFDQPFGIAVDATHVYWTEPNAGTIMKTRKP
jgi:hypothetical protein